MAKYMASRVTGIGPTWFERRQLGFKNPLGTCDHVYEQMYSSIVPCSCWDYSLNNTKTSIHGGVFSLEFSPEGSLLVAACEKKSVLVFDPLTHKRIHTVENAHTDCVNCVKFLDSRSFATCSDDFTVALWDARNLNQKVRTLRGHSNWVKNIEYSPQDGLLVTSGFDGSILTWDMNEYRETGTTYNKVFATNGLMRTRLTPDASKMIICTTGGYLIVIHNLDLNSLNQDLDGFKPNMYRLMQLSQTILPIASDFTHLFRGHGKRNRVEFITDFPNGDDAEVVSSLQIHPDGHSAVSRNVSNDEQSEWSCIHNIEERLTSDESDCSDEEDECVDVRKIVGWPGSSTSISTTPSYIIQHTVVQNENNRGTARTESNAGVPDQRDLSISPSDVWEALVAIQDARIRRERDRAAPEMMVRNMFRRQASDAGVQVRPPISGPDNRIFVTRILPSTSSAHETSHNETVSTAPVPRRNVSVSATELDILRPEERPSTSTDPEVARPNNRRVFRRKLPLRERYYSLYRRSRVGQYDRTSILRRPIYNLRVTNVKLKRLKTNTKLNTNYEMNETQRIQNELENGRVNFNIVLRNDDGDSALGSGIRIQEGQRSILRRRLNLALRNCVPRIVKPATSSQSAQTRSSPINSALNSLRQDISSIENNLNSFRETVNTLEGTISSALKVLRRSEDILQSINHINGDDENHPSTSQEPPAAEVPVENEDQVTNEVIDHEEVVEDASASTVSGCEPPPTSEPPENNERTILMGVFRAGNEDGVRGTSMRRHNIAALTVSSSTQGMSDSLMDGLDWGRSRGSGSSSSSSAGSCNNNRTSTPKKHYTKVSLNKKIHQNVNRLTHYIEEPNLGRGFIKELCISPDGRVVCSPFGNGIRLLSFSPSVQDLSHCYPRTPPIQLHELSLNMAHTDVVVSTKFSPFHNLLVSGCLSGKIVYYQPLL